MKFNRIEHVLSACRKHLEDTNTLGTEIESYLVGYLLATIISEYDMRIKRLIELRMERVQDPQLLRFLNNSAKRIIRSIDISEISGKVLGAFDDEYKAVFQSGLNDQMRAAYNNIKTNRESVSHGSGSNMTLVEVEAAFKASSGVLDALATALELSESELSRI